MKYKLILFSPWLLKSPVIRSCNAPHSTILNVDSSASGGPV